MAKISEIDDVLHAIEQMVEVTFRATENLTRSEHDKLKFEMPAQDAQLLDFSTSDIAMRAQISRP